MGFSALIKNYVGKYCDNYTALDALSNPVPFTRLWYWYRLREITRKQGFYVILSLDLSIPKNISLLP